MQNEILILSKYSKGVIKLESVSAVYKMNIHIDLRDVDFTKKLKISTLFSYFQDIASMASENLGYGIGTLEETFGVAWILTRIRVDLIRFPDWDEEVTIETWPLEPGKVEFDRDYLVKDKNGDMIIKAISSWVIMDINERKLRRSELIDLHFPETRKGRAIDHKLGKLKDFGNLQLVYNKVIGYSDIDFNGHLNNSKYVDYIMDCFLTEEHKKYAVKSIELNFLNEALPGDTITLYKDISKSDAGIIYIEGINQKDDKTVFKAKVEIVDKHKD